MTAYREARQRLHANRHVMTQRLADASRSKQTFAAKLRVVPKAWYVVGGLATGAIVGRLPARALAAAIGAVTAFSLRLLGTPLGPMAIGAMMARHRRGAGDETPRGDESPARTS